MRRTSFLSTTESLLWTVTVWEASLVILLGTLSPTGPLAWLGMATRLGLDEAGRIGRIVMLYHSLAIPFVAALVYLILDALPFDEIIPRLVRPTITAGYFLTSTGGLSFAYLRAGWIAHGVFLVGLSLTFYAGAILWWGLSPWRAPDGRSLERWAFWLMALYSLISAAIGGAVGAHFGHGFKAFLAEDLLRVEHDLFQRAIIAHLHIMLTLIDVALLLLVAHRVGITGLAYKITIPLIIAGTTITTFATWSVIFVGGVAHRIITVGAVILLTGAAIVALYGMRSLIRERPDRPALKALLSDPVSFGMLFQLLFVNLVVTAPGIWVAVNLEAIRAGDLAWERTFAVGHWHVLATLSATIGLLLVVDRLGARGWLRQAVGWGVLAGSILAFSAAQLYMFRQPGTAPAQTTILVIDAGIGLFFLALGLWAAATGPSVMRRPEGRRD
ncbi:MAG: hypothetical protein RMK30_06280 [Anaerolineae bacterium]|nr:hypothetical protein [Anaerolineae bacterium]MDW8102466.1 hypothetical protein [Anaerolineae bacterium]